jgi:F-type H+-transporting ATPase subunit epsilon
MPLRVQIITQERQLYDEQADMVVAPGTEGVMGILPQHAPLVSPLDFGEVRIKRGDSEDVIAVGGGVLRVAHDHVIILAEFAEAAEEIVWREPRRRGIGLML